VRTELRVLVLAAAATSAAALVAPATTATVPACTTPKLVVWVDGQPDAAAGSVFRSLAFTNQSGQTCALTGFPGVSAVDLNGHALGTPAARTSATPARVVLANGATAHATLKAAQAANFPAVQCHAAAAAGVRVYPPGQTTSKVVPFPLSACARRGPVFLTTGPVQR
jgi:hypothetical protein